MSFRVFRSRVGTSDLHGKDIAELSDDECATPMHYDMIHFIEDRRVESKLVKDFPGYHYYLYAARKLGLAMGLNAVEHYMGFYGGQSEDGVHREWTVPRLCMIISVLKYYTRIFWTRVIICGKYCLFPVMTESTASECDLEIDQGLWGIDLQGGCLVCGNVDRVVSRKGDMSGSFLFAGDEEGDEGY